MSLRPKALCQVHPLCKLTGCGLGMHIRAAKSTGKEPREAKFKGNEASFLPRNGRRRCGKPLQRSMESVFTHEVINVRERNSQPAFDAIA